MPEGFIQRCSHMFERPRTSSLRETAAAETRHDALQSVSAISALAAAGAETVADPQLTRRRFHQIETEVHALRELVQGVDARVEPQVLDIAAEARVVVDSLRVDYPGVIGVVARVGTPALVRGTALHRILNNLLRNAMRAAGADGRVLVTVARCTSGVVLLVEDDGPGFGALLVVNGLGLRSVRRLVHEAGGTLQARARGRLGGAAVQVHLPAAAETEMAS